MPADSAAERTFAESVWNSIVTQEGESPSPQRSIGRQTQEGLELELPADLPRLRLGPDGDLEIVEEIGRGGMGQVDLAFQRCLRREVALKRLHAEASPGARQALIQEALHMGALVHPNIVPAYLLGRDEHDRPVLLMQRVTGVEWLELIQEPEHPRWSELPADRLQFHIDVLRQLCNALSFAHSRGILHRDLKPANVMLGQFGEVYLLDWGLSIRLDTPRAASAPIVGTPAYFAPEMADVTQPLSTRTDVYLLGATLHHVLTGQPRHTSGPDGARSVIFSAFRSEPVDYDAQVPAELAALCNRATHRDPDQRPASALAFRRRLEDFLQHRGSVRACDNAQEALATLRELMRGPAPAEQEPVLACFTASRLGFEQALEDWSGNESARAGLQECLELRIDHELELRNKGTAQELLLCLPDPRPDLEARLERLRTQLREEALSSQQLRSMQQDLDVTFAGRSRAALFLLVGVLVGGGMLVTAALSAQGAIQLTFTAKFLYQVTLPIGFAILLYLARDRLLGTSGGRKIAACAWLVLAAPLLGSVVNQGIHPEVHSATASVLQTTILIVMAVAFDRRIGWIALVTGAIAAGCVLWPEQFLVVQGVGTLLAFVVAARVTQPVLRQAACQPTG